MARRHIDPVEVVRSGGEPARFLWHNKLYVVRDVLGHWVENEEWWQAGAAGAGAGRGESAVGAGRTATATASVTATAAAPAGTALLAAEREVWRVEAAAGRSFPLGVFDLRLDAQGAWTLARTLD
ncbi:DUF6504 family protein [Yinghuangia soli]|uniref:DUF6504 family protein n=1 Tax=Yinghuangia soli TaxID=2908204 RepID=A0AA41U306_9ACTN|nr:DUF6504 family protein [Yinghuangia soli]MCF2531285.1 DUF6504 family protein [Yinghuangia soli]